MKHVRPALFGELLRMLPSGFRSRRRGQRARAISVAALLLPMALWSAGCSTKEQQEPQLGSQTNWLKSCELSNQCGDLSCICGVCTRTCEEVFGCRGLAGAECVDSSGAGAHAQCGEEDLGGVRICLPPCEGPDCNDETPSVPMTVMEPSEAIPAEPEMDGGTDAGCGSDGCPPEVFSSVRVEVDRAFRYQVLQGFGASLAYGEYLILEYAQQAALYDAMFVDSGLDVIRFRNRYEAGEEESLTEARDILEAARARMANEPITLMTSGSPPAYLKANDRRGCSGDPDVCTLKQLEDGQFDYAGFADHWRASLEAYGALGVFPDYISIQNHPDWVPPAAADLEACKFLPTEGTQQVETADGSVERPFPGFVEALASVRSAISDLESPPRIAGPEDRSPAVAEGFLPALSPTAVELVAFSMYGVELDGPQESLDALKQVGGDFGRPIAQTEMLADGPETAVLMQLALTHADAAMYLQNDFVTPDDDSDGAEFALIRLGAEGPILQGPYHVFRHFALRTDRGWERVEAQSSADEVLVSAFLSPNEDALTLILVNRGVDDQTVQLALASQELGVFESSEIFRTVFGTSEAFAELGTLPSTGVVELPAGAIMTVALSQP